MWRRSGPFFAPIVGLVFWFSAPGWWLLASLWTLRGRSTDLAPPGHPGGEARPSPGRAIASDRASFRPRPEDADRVSGAKLREAVLKEAEAPAARGQVLRSFGSLTDRHVNATKAAFDAQAARSAVERDVRVQLRQRLLRIMRRQRRELRPKEKLPLLHAAMADYDSRVRLLPPHFAADSERDQVLRRLSTVQWGITDTPEGQEMVQRWQAERRPPPRNPKGFSVSLSPGVRVLLRPRGFGNFQLSSRRHAGVQHNPGDIFVGVVNDGSVVDVRARKPRPQFLQLQPTLGVRINLR